MDFDGARHNMESLEQAKKRDEAKISRVRWCTFENNMVYHGKL